VEGRFDFRADVKYLHFGAIRNKFVTIILATKGGDLKMKRVFILVLITIIAGIFISGCGPKTETDDEITSVIYKNLNAMENKDIQSYMATIHEQSVIYAPTKQAVQQVFDTYDLKCELKDVKVIEKSDQEAKVKFVQITKKINGPAFRNNKLTGIHILKKSDGKWKIYNSETKNIEHLD
jgi:ketosteroid isomerase-like protein